MTDGELTLHEAAESLGVHYMTAYRYVRLGILAAQKSKGTWRVRSADLEDFRNGKHVDGPNVAHAADVEVPDDGRKAPWSDRLEARLLAGDLRGSWGVIEASLASGANLDHLYLEVMSPAMRSIGHRWQNGEIDVFVEHRASVIAMRLISRIGPRFARRGRTRRIVILGAPTGEQHALPLAMVADIVRTHGWEVFDLGIDVPAPSFANAVAASVASGEEQIIVGMSVTTAGPLDELARSISAVRSMAPVTIVVGGAGIADLAHAAALGADHYAPDARSFTGVLDSLQNGT